MTWREERFKQGTFRDIPFHIESHRYRSGRRIQDHQFPFVQRNYAEDLGKRTDEFEIVAFILGPDYDLERNKFLQALKKPGRGILVHPYLNKIEVVVNTFELVEDRENGDFCKFRIQFIEAGALDYPRESKDDRNYIDALATEVEANGLEGFVQTYVTNPLNDFRDGLAKVRGLVNNFLSYVNTVKQAHGAIVAGISELELAIDALSADANQLRLLPANLLEKSVAVIDSFNNTFSTARGRFEAMTNLANYVDPAGGRVQTAGDEADAKNQLALAMIFRGRPLAGAVRAANELEYGSTEEAFLIRDRLLARIDALSQTQVVRRVGEQDELVATFPVPFLESLADLRSSIVLRFPLFNGIASGAVERSYSQEKNSILALYEMTGSIQSIDFFLQDNQLIEGFIAPGRIVRASNV